LIIVDTNVISDAIAPKPSPMVLEWLAAQPVNDLWTTAITAAELRAGAAALQESRRKTTLSAAIENALSEDFSGRILPFDNAASVAFATISARRRRLGLSIGHMDMQIAAIAVVHAAVVATRNTYHFEEAGLILINPWDA
jgi:predicted nucleic acid-binding protein